LLLFASPPDLQRTRVNLPILSSLALANPVPNVTSCTTQAIVTMTDNAAKTVSQGAATGAAWTDTERVRHLTIRSSLTQMEQMAYLIVVAEHALAAPIESKISVRTSLYFLMCSN